MKIAIRKVSIIPLLFLLFIGCKGDSEEDSVADFKAENRKALGTSAADLLSNDIYSGLTVELVYSEAFRPAQETIDNFTTFLSQRINKPNGINFVETMIPAPQGFPFTTGEIRDIEDERRTRYTEGDNIAVFIFFSNGNSDNDTDTSVTLGTAYQNTSIVIYEKTVREIASQQNIDTSLLESTTLHHEFGHLFGLVNIQDDDIHTNHEDNSQTKHCIVENCLMYFETRNTNKAEINRYMKANKTAAIPQFDTALCLEDLSVKGGK